MSTTLNLARKWRPRTFNDVVGQPVAVNMLRNSLYKNHFFPVYLFAGQKGCGKTSTARILAAAANCSNLELFQKTPDITQLPCLSCRSCLHMQSGTHPDFIEIDAASHTGVDDVRTLLESCSFLPLVGSKKIYLIDEAHMLSKAAFNAFLKILEEPPAHTLFMLATTEILKIPDTVRSRCFQLHFNGLPTLALVEHLATICSQEGVDATPDALTLIVNETEGSARDALNILEQVRFSAPTITIDTVRATLGIMSIDRLAHLIELMVTQKVPDVLNEINTLSSMRLNPNKTWHLLLQTIRMLLWHSYHVAPLAESISLGAEIKDRILKNTSSESLQKMLDYLWHQEELFLQTPYKQAFLEKIYIAITTGAYHAVRTIQTLPPEKGTPKVAPRADSPKQEPLKQAAAPSLAAPTLHNQPLKTTPPQTATPWTEFCHAITAIQDPILSSIINQARFVQANTTTGTVTIALAQASPFFKEKIQESHAHWRPLLARYFSGCSALEITAIEGAPLQQPPTPRQPEKAIALPPQKPATGQTPSAPKQPPYKTAYAQKPKSSRPSESLAAGAPLILNDDNKAQWPYTSLLSALFPGKVEVIASPPKS
jgi:DNA polymerase-3 subunit gamma/tau